ncbi:uncharacterized protein LOC122296729 [Carya illinoinensis]|uniref:uncharacterized protein LOC122296729 n=1 Tax=Carya illinoinensis TaxID=32201 RepID=UPI001C71BDF8|nr:uncharacterized protein LOC122296729 [Carya illinoinensis]
MQGHNLKLCKWKDGLSLDRKIGEKMIKVWKPLKPAGKEKQHVEIGMNALLANIEDTGEAGPSGLPVESLGINLEEDGKAVVLVGETQTAGALTEKQNTENVTGIQEIMQLPSEQRNTETQSSDFENAVGDTHVSENVGDVHGMLGTVGSNVKGQTEIENVEINLIGLERSTLEGLKSSRRRLCKLVRKLHLNFLMLAEPFADDQRMVALKQLLRFDCCFSNLCVGGKLWLLWKEDLQISVVSYSAQHVTISMCMDNRNFVVSVVYAKCNHVERRELWRVLQLDVVQDAPWLCLGDFNTIRGEEEHYGGRPRLRAAIDEFNEFIDNYGFIEKKTVGSKFSWCNGQRGLAQSWSKLDRCLMNVVAADVFPNACCKYIARSTSNHTHLSFVFKNLGTRYGPSSFKFQQMWVSHSNFLNMVKENWSALVDTMGLIGLATKLKKLKIVLKDWNRHIFGHTDTNIQVLENKIEQLETQLQVGFLEDVEQDLLGAKEDLEMWMQREETRLSQHVKLRWMEKGEASAQFFKTFASLKKPIVQARARRELPDLSYLVQIPFLRRKMITSFSSLRSKRACWDIVEDDVVAAVWDFFIGNSMPRFYSASYIALIPKMQKPIGFDKFHSISLCSVVYKVFSKILVRRLSHILNKIISPKQGAFLPGRSIFENISLAQEMIHMLNKKVRGGNTVIKIDMAKAYNSID